ncbi:MAG: sulfatase-like hydrolase/transferase [Bacteroidales bacterium]|nr:sulfatase-like hydrolase/transferase [Bacteroidales bacterium]
MLAGSNYMKNMSRNEYGKTFLFVSSALLVAGCSIKNSGSEKEHKPNILIILADDLGYGDISCFGQRNYVTTNIDSLAGQSVICTDFYVPTPYSAPSRATLLTGRFPLRHGLIENPAPDAGINDVGIDADEITLGDVFREAGYRTKCIGKWHLGHKSEYFPTKHGFDEYYGILYSNDMRPVQIIENLDTVEYPVDQRLLTKKYTQKAIEFITINRDKPFFLHLCHAMPHKPLAASDQFFTPETPDDLYADVIRELDWSVGEILNTLKNLGILENTIVIFMSDNGPWYGGSTGGLKGMKATTWEGGIRVPFMISYPKLLPENVKVNTPCWSPDLFPTLLSLADVEPETLNPLDGNDITDILQGKETVHGPVFSMHNNRIMSVRKGEWKLFLHNPGYRKEIDLSKWKDSRAPDGTTIIASEGQATPALYPGIVPVKTENEIQLYNLKNDPTESNDLSEINPNIVKELLDETRRFEASFNMKK